MRDPGVLLNHRRAAGVAAAVLPVVGCLAAVAAEPSFSRFAEAQRPSFLSELRFG